MSVERSDGAPVRSCSAHAPLTWAAVPRCRGAANTVHHVIPSSEAPHLFFDEGNLQASCGACNYSVSAYLTRDNRRAIVEQNKYLEHVVLAQEERIIELEDQLANGPRTNGPALGETGDPLEQPAALRDQRGDQQFGERISPAVLRWDTSPDPGQGAARNSRGIAELLLGHGKAQASFRRARRAETRRCRLPRRRRARRCAHPLPEASERVAEERRPRLACARGDV